MTDDPGTDLVTPTQLLDVSTGELLPATPENAAAALLHAREMKNKIQAVIRDVEAFMGDQSRVQGTKTFQTPWGALVGSGGLATSYDPEVLAEALRAAGCPEGRISEAVVATVSYKVDQRVLRQLTSANPDYRLAAETAKIETETPLRFSVKPR